MAKSKARLFADLADKMKQTVATLSGVTQQTVDNVPANNNNAVIFNIVATRGIDYHYATVTAVRTANADCDYTQFGDIYSSAELANYIVDINNGIFRLRATATNSGDTTYKITRIGIER